MVTLVTDTKDLRKPYDRKTFNIPALDALGIQTSGYSVMFCHTKLSWSINAKRAWEP